MASKLTIVSAGITALLLTGFTPAKPDFGLRTGNVWTYHMKSDDREYTVKETALQWVDVAGGYKALEIKTEHSGGHEGYKYLGQDERGLLAYYNGAMRGPGIDRNTAPVVLAKLPFNTGLKWEWIEAFRGQTAGEVDNAELERMKSFESAVVVSDREDVTVPTGTYKAIHVRKTSTSDAFGKRTEDHWYVFGIGLVKSVYASDDGKFERTLTKFEAAK